MAMPAMHSAQNAVMRCLGGVALLGQLRVHQRGGVGGGVMKKIASITTTTAEMMPAPGSWSTTAKKISCGAGSDSDRPVGRDREIGVGAMPTVFPAASVPAGPALQPERGAAEDGEGEHNDRGGVGRQQHAEHELSDGAAAGDLRGEHADEGRPADPPRPVEGGPAREEGLHVLALGCSHRACRRVPKYSVIAPGMMFIEHGGADGEDEHGQHEGERHVDVRQPADAAARDPGDRRGDRAEGQHADDHHGERRARGRRTRRRSPRPGRSGGRRFRGRRRCRRGSRYRARR